MDYPARIETLEGNQRDSWNDEIEEFLGKPQSPLKNFIAVEFDEAAVQTSLQTVASDLKKELGASVTKCEAGECDPDIWRVVRTGKNLLRWYIQIYLEQLQVQRQRQQSHGGCTIDVLRLPDSLSGVIQILKWSVEGCKNLELARDASLYVFYATYSHFPGDKTASTGIEHLISNLHFPKECLEILMKTNSVSLALTLIRNLHSMTVSFPTARSNILDAKVWCDPSVATQPSPWAPKESTFINFSESCLALMQWSFDASPSFPSENPDDKRAELVIEILNCFYAMRKGQELGEPTSRVDVENDNPSLRRSIIYLLQLRLPERCNTKTADEIIFWRIHQCKLSTVSLLMDSDVSFGEYLVDIDSFDPLLKIFEHQVDEVVGKTQVDNTATATLVPILVVLNRYSLASSVVQQKVKAFVFPTETDKKFQQSIKENWKTKMSPLDAPKDTQRGKLIVLLSWVDGYIKRCSAELMWTLCNSDSSEFTFRVGLGNALPLLNAKGLSPIRIPS
jgi:hypothetical protein